MVSGLIYMRAGGLVLTMDFSGLPEHLGHLIWLPDIIDSGVSCLLLRAAELGQPSWEDNEGGVDQGK